MGASIRLIVSEKPSMGRAIAAALGIQGSGRSFIQGGDVIVTWCVGHLVEALAPEGYDPALKQWRMDRLPFFPEAFRYAPIEATKDQYQVVERLMNREDVTEIVNATDAGREGELIFDLVYRLSGTSKPVVRFWTSSLTDDAIREAYGRMKPGTAYEGLRDAARCRQEADWLVGINCTRAQTLAQRRSGGEGVFSVGRVQTPTLALLVNRELEIQNFVPKDFWTLWAVFQAGAGTYRGKWFRKEDGKDVERFDTEAAARDLAEALKGHPGKVASVTARTEKKKPELLYDLTALQKEANKRFGFTAEHTLEVAQDLYEAKLISYPRTNSRCLTEADAAKAPGWIRSLAQGQLEELRPYVDQLRKRWPVKLDKRFVNDKEVEDHSALVPTETPARSLSGDRLKIYELIARRFLAAFWPDRIEGKTTIVTHVLKEAFKTTGTVVKELGWSEVDPPHSRPRREAKAEDGEEPEEEESGLLPAVTKGEAVETRELFPKAGKTTPPKRMSEADLLGAMQSAGKELDDEELKGAMKDCGLGTPATRANIIETLLKRGYVERKRNILQPTPKGIELVRSLKAEVLTSPQLTGEWEAKMERIRRGEAARDAFMEGIRAFVSEVIAQIRDAAPARPRPATGPVVGTCPRCGSSLHLRTWEGAHYARCGATADPECKVGFACGEDGAPLETCRRCRGPLRTTRAGAKVCVACGAWDADLPEHMPEAGTCPSCGQPMRLVPSTARGQWFRRCAPCGRTEPAV
ncbi:DNA topoisomerase 3 [Mesoterricola sediminis]|uniref:DNA topoisomerase n=1 Tax=Mesoterricola sediminis TaxID=2927980 RepID=A0AA48GTL1_9BACT|nr:DNA topoisomerase 3 [Mesoterricola sediminis]BDU77367.1 DNA topoisomerase [Mesoterricola sediminis]